MLILGPSGMRPDAWVFRSQGKSVSVRLEGRLNISVNEVATSAAVAGLGIASTAIWGCREELERGELARVLTDWDMGTVDVHAVLPAGRASKPASRAFVDYLAEPMKYWNAPPRTFDESRSLLVTLNSHSSHLSKEGKGPPFP